MRNTKLARELRAFLNSPSAAVSLAPVSGSNHAAASGGNGILVDANQVVSLDPNAAGAGLTYGGGILAVGAGSGLTVGADSVALTTPGTLTAVTGNSAAGSHTHAITASADVSGDGAGVMNLLRTTAGGATVKTFTASLQVSTPKVISPASTNITLEPAGDITGKKVNLASGVGIGAHDYESQAKGWHITHAGAADFRYVYTDEMHAKSFIADLEQALAGGQIIPKSVAVLSRAFALPAAGAAATLYLRDLPSAENMAVFQSGDIVRLRTFARSGGSLTIADAWGVVTAYSDLADKEQSWTFTRSSAPNAGTASGTIAADSIILDYGTTGNGWAETNAIDGAYGLNSPYTQIATWTTHPATGSAVRVRTGNLRGITGSTEYGLWAGSATLGNLLITGDKVALRQGTTEKITLDTTGNSYFSGVMTIGTSGEIRQGTVTSGEVWNSLTGFTGLRLWRDTNIGRIGGYNAGTLQWYGSTDGRMYGGGGAVYLDSGGLGLTVHPSSLTDTNAVTWRTGGPTGATAAKIGAYASGGTSVLRMQAGSNYLFMASSGYSDFNQTLYLASGGAHAIVATNLGVGLTPDVDTPAASIHIKGSTPKIRIEHSSTGAAILDFVGDSTYTDWGTRFARGSTGANTASYLQHRGTGALILQAYDAGSVELQTQATKRLEVTSDGLVGIGGTPGTYERLRIQGGPAGSDKIVLKMQSTNAYGPLVSLQSGARDWELRSSYSNDSTSGAFEVINRTDTRVAATLMPTGTLRLGSADANKAAHVAPRESITLDNGATATFAGNPAGLVVLMDIVGNNVGLYLLRGSTGQTPVLVSETPASTHSAADTAGRNCFYWDATESKYVIKNRSGSNGRVYCVVHLGSTGYS